MRKNLIILGLVSIFMLVTISFASAINTNNINAERKESPLFGIRTRQAIAEKISSIINNIRIKFLGERMFFLPFESLRNKNSLFLRERFRGETESETCGLQCQITWQGNTCDGKQAWTHSYCWGCEPE